MAQICQFRHPHNNLVLWLPFSRMSTCFALASFQIRHGAGVGLREVLKAHGRSGGKIGDSTVEEVGKIDMQIIIHGHHLCIQLYCCFSFMKMFPMVKAVHVHPAFYRKVE